MVRLSLLSLISIAISITSVAASPVAAPAPEAAPSPFFGDLVEAYREWRCENPRKRKEWRQLTIPERKEYIRAVKCLMVKPSIYGPGTDIPGAKSRYDDFHGVHISMTSSIHFVGHFLPWHRYFVAAYEKALIEECQYKGAQPYWDWTIDANKGQGFQQSELFNNEHGFGSDGDYVAASGPFVIPDHTGGGCVKSGPFFGNRVMNLGPGTNLQSNPRCLKRDLAGSILYQFANSQKVAGVMAETRFDRFAKAVDGEPSFTAMGIHGPGHFSIGGEAGDMNSSPGEPLFYLHHANLDRVWWEWQQRDLARRVLDIGGPVAMMQYSGKNVTLLYPVDLGRLAPKQTILQLMHIKVGGQLCYDY